MGGNIVGREKGLTVSNDNNTHLRILQSYVYSRQARQLIKKDGNQARRQSDEMELEMEQKASDGGGSYRER